MAGTWNLLQLCAAQTWAPVWSDSDALGLALTALYLSATLLCLLTALALWGGRGWGRPAVPGRWLWTLATLYLALLTVNKPLDLQTFLTQTARCLARSEGWYADRRAFQEDVTFFLLIGLAAAVLAGLGLLSEARRGEAPLILGLVLLTGFLGLRILSLHSTDQALALPVLGLPLHRVIEMSSLVLINCAALPRRRPR